MSAECSECGADVVGPDFECLACVRGKLLDQVRKDVREIVGAFMMCEDRRAQELAEALSVKLDVIP